MRRGDLLFWKGHVALIVDDSRLIHANGHSMSVAYEATDACIARVLAAENSARHPPPQGIPRLNGSGSAQGVAARNTVHRWVFSVSTSMNPAEISPRDQHSVMPRMVNLRGEMHICVVPVRIGWPNTSCA